MRMKRSNTTGALALVSTAVIVLSIGVVPGPARAVTSPCAVDDPYQTVPSYGDFDGDHYGDVAFGEPSRTTASGSGSGAVRVLHSCAPDVVLTPADLGYGASPGAHLGTSTASADLDGDNYLDLVVSLPRRNQVAFVYGSAGGLNKGAPARLWPGAVTYLDFNGACTSCSTITQNSAAAGGDVAEAGDHFGATLTADFDVHRKFVLPVIGVPGEDVGPAKDGGKLAGPTWWGSTAVIDVVAGERLGEVAPVIRVMDY